MTKGGVESPSDVVSELLTYILDVCRAPYSEPPPPPDCYLPPCSIESELSFSHSFIFELGRETMLLTTCWKTNTLIYAENCPMAILHFPHGGIFTSFCCPHGICLCLRWVQIKLWVTYRHPFHNTEQGAELLCKYSVCSGPFQLVGSCRLFFGVLPWYIQIHVFKGY